MGRFLLCLIAVVATSAATCQTTAVTGGNCTNVSDCEEGEACVNGTCVGPAVCNNDAQCPADQICGGSGFCEAAGPLPEVCSVTHDCPINAYCNTALEQPTCVSLQPGACREQSQCAGQVCSALPGGVGRCVDCLQNSDCPSLQCLSSGTCAAGGSDAGTGHDASVGRDAGSGSDDPNCGAEAQACCGAGSTQTTPCDSSGLGCARDFPAAGASTCWRRCNATPCTTLENGNGWCHIGVDNQGAYVGSCQAAQAYDCSVYDRCQNYYPGTTATCVWMSDVDAYCFRMGCDWQADCGSGYYCSTFDGNLCLSLSLLGG